MSENNVTLNDLAGGAVPTATPVGMPRKLNTANVREANISEAVVQSKPEVIQGTGNPMLDTAFLGLDDAIARTQSETNATYQSGVEQRLEEAIDSNDGDIDAVLDNANPSAILVHNFDSDTNVTSVSTTPTTTPAPATITTEVEVSAPVSGTKTENISMVSDTSVYDDPDDHLFDGADGIDDEDLQYLDEDESTSDKTTEDDDEKAKTEEIKQTIRQEVSKNFKPYNNTLDLNGFTIATKPISAARVINQINKKVIECADGVLWNNKRAIRMSAWAPMEIQSIDPQRIRQGNYNKYIENKLKLIYDHIIDANKPKTFESWAMLTPNTVVDDYMFTAYKATFGLSNIITFSCNDNKCSNVFMESIPVHSMIKFTNDEIKEKYMKILHEGNTDSTEADLKYKVTLFQASDDYVLGLKVPSLYNTYIEPTLVDQAFNNKYEDRLLLMSYIDSIYKIDYTNSQLIRIDPKPTVDKALSYKRRIKTFDTVLKTLTSDQLMNLYAETDKYDGGKLDDDGNLVTDVTYIYPERKCPKCGKKIDEQVVNPDNMLFTRHQLGLMRKI